MCNLKINLCLNLNTVVIFFVLFINLVGFGSTSVPTISLCSKVRTQHHYLNASGFGSALTVTFNNENMNNTKHGPCKLQINGPSSHIVSVLFVTAPISGESLPKKKNSSCILNIFLPEERLKVFKKVDPCRDSDPFPHSRLVVQLPLRIVWNPPSGEIPEVLARTQVIFTAVGQGNFCRQEKQHTCAYIGNDPMWCVAEELICDGIQHCPRSETKSDEDPAMCQTKTLQHIPAPWDYITQEWVKRLPPEWQKSSILPISALDRNRWIRKNAVNSVNIGSTTQNSVLIQDNDQNVREANQVDTISAALAHYGPWGYLMLGMLICGTVLMFCGLWECFCRKSKPAPTPIRRVPLNVPTVIITTTTVDDSPPTPGPPSYDDLDQPPTYAALFPESKRNSIILHPLNLIARSNSDLTEVVCDTENNSDNNIVNSDEQISETVEESTQQNANSDLDSNSAEQTQKILAHESNSSEESVPQTNVALNTDANNSNSSTSSTSSSNSIQR